MELWKNPNTNQIGNRNLQMRPCINFASAHLPWQRLIRKYNRGLGWNPTERFQRNPSVRKDFETNLQISSFFEKNSISPPARVTSYGRDNISVFAKLHNFLISERLLMYLEAPSLTTAAVGHKMHNVIFLLPRPISTPTLNCCEGKQIQKSIFCQKEILFFGTSFWLNRHPIGKT